MTSLFEEPFPKALAVGTSPHRHVGGSGTSAPFSGRRDSGSGGHTGTGAASVNRLPVRNGGDDVLCLFLEPYGDVFWLKPGDEFTVLPGEGVPDPQFTVEMVKHRLIVWVFEGGDPAKVVVDCTVVDSGGNELPEGHQWPDGRSPY
ncbi:hypothetical protein ACIQRC_18470 [Streptomyces californicus]|uniref:hypothetical protein n=1 Tax=Streptomyces californicus TaxID=67351 RepID=UPI000A9D733D